jgi:hypothetical protein
MAVVTEPVSEDSEASDREEKLLVVKADVGPAGSGWAPPGAGVDSGAECAWVPHVCSPGLPSVSA